MLFLQQNVIPLGPFGVFLASIAEEVIAPIPSALVMMTAGFLFITGPVNLANIIKLAFFVGLPAGLGVALGSLWVYGVAYWGGKNFLDRCGKWIGLYWSDVEKMQTKFESGKTEELSIIGARIVPFVPSVAISAFCGFIRMKFWKYFLLTFIGMFLRGMVMGAIGWQVGNVYYKYAATISRFENIFLISIVLAGIICVAVLFWRKKIGYIENKEVNNDRV